MPTWHAFSENSEIEFELEHIDCYACAHKDEAEKAEKKKKPGRTNFVKARHVDGEELPGRREFFEELEEKANSESKDEE